MWMSMVNGNMKKKTLMSAPMYYVLCATKKPKQQKKPWKKEKSACFLLEGDVVVGVQCRKDRTMFNRGASKKTWMFLADGSVYSGWRQIQNQNSD
jgi:hypothetical protein